MPRIAADWDRSYGAADGGLFGEAPTLWLRTLAARPDFAPRSALMLADGDGRNGAWLAARGVATTAVDLSPVATERARARDARAGVTVERVVADLAAWRPPEGRRFDCATLLFLQGPPALRARALGVAVDALAPGGWLALEGFGRARADLAALGPEDGLARWTLDEALALAKGLAVVEAFEGLALLDEGPRHAGLGALVRLAARAPGAAGQASAG